MKDDRVTREQPSSKRGGASRRAAQAEVANYIHELSDRHESGAPTSPDSNTAAAPQVRTDDA